MSISGGFLALPMEGDPKSEGTDAVWVRAPEGGFGFCTTVTWLKVVIVMMIVMMTVK